LDKAFCKDFVKEFFRAMSYELKAGREITVVGFGKFKTDTVPEHEYHTPDGRRGVCKTKLKAKFYAGEKLKAFLEDKIDEM